MPFEMRNELMKFNNAADDANANNDVDDDELLDTSWLNKFNQDELNYNIFYKEPIISIQLFIIYINTDNELIHRVKYRYVLDEPNRLNHEQVLSLINHYQHYNLKQYKLNSLLQYNIDLNPEEISDYVNEPISINNNNRFIISLDKHLADNADADDDISYKDSITMFHDLNALYFIFVELPITHKNNITKKIRLTTRHKTKRINHKKNLKILKEIE